MNQITVIQVLPGMLVLVPAYGRAYETKDEVLNDWELGLDFKIPGGPYCSIRDVNTIKEGYDILVFCYSPNKEPHMVIIDSIN